MRPHRALLHPNIDMIYGGSCVESNNNPGQAAPNTRHEMDGETGAELGWAGLGWAGLGWELGSGLELQTNLRVDYPKFTIT